MYFYFDWAAVLWSLIFFLIASFGSIALVVWVLVTLPVTYYQDVDSPSCPPAKLRSQRHWLAGAARNICGIVLIVVGAILSIPGVPGQGLLTILVGLVLVDLPGKRRLEPRLVKRPRILHALNRLRGRFGKQPLIVDDPPSCNPSQAFGAQAANEQSLPGASAKTESAV